jgi:hypothetical protein
MLGQVAHMTCHQTICACVTDRPVSPQLCPHGFNSAHSPAGHESVKFAICLDPVSLESVLHLEPALQLGSDLPLDTTTPQQLVTVIVAPGLAKN